MNVSSTSPSMGPDRGASAAHHNVGPGEIALGVAIGRIAEFFNFFVYGIGSALVFPKVFFPFADPLTGDLYAFVIFAFAFIARPVGLLIFLPVEQQYGRAVKLTMALFLLGGSTVAISFLPGYNDIGWAAIALLAIFRVGQGLASGGSWDGLASLLSLTAPPDRRGWYAMIPQLGAPFGFMLASGLFAYFYNSLPTEDFLDWGWRYPFYAAFTINVVALFARLRLTESEEYAYLLANRELEPTNAAEMFTAQGRYVLIGAFVPLATFALFHVVTIFPLSWLSIYADRPIGGVLLVQCLGSVLGVVGVCLSGILADLIGRRVLIALCAGLIGAFSLLIPEMFATHRGQDLFLILGFGILGLSFGQAAGSVASNFSARYRYTGAALTSDLSWLIGAGFAPLVALGVAARFGLSWVSLYVLSGVICTWAALYFNKLDTREIASNPDDTRSR